MLYKMDKNPLWNVFLNILIVCGPQQCDVSLLNSIIHPTHSFLLVCKLSSEALTMYIKTIGVSTGLITMRRDIALSSKFPRKKTKFMT